MNGLKIGAPVNFKGVEIGSVTQIRLQLKKDIRSGIIPIIVEMDRERHSGGNVTSKTLYDPELYKVAIAQGLRRQLQTD